jgi:hypothetical protein
MLSALEIVETGKVLEVLRCTSIFSFQIPLLRMPGSPPSVHLTVRLDERI